jgi:hypothetical protein
MKTNHAVRLAILVGLLVGVIIFAIVFVLPHDLFVCRAIIAMQSPLIPIINWLQPASQPWGSNNDIYKIWIAVLFYWMSLGLLLGLLVGFGYKLLVGRKNSRVA